MKYVALYKGEGKGCDYTIACNRDFDVFEAPNDEEAIAKCKEKLDAHSEPKIGEVRLLAIAEEVHVPDRAQLEADEQTRRKALRASAWSKLTPAERKALSL